MSLNLNTAKQALVTTATVLAVIYALRMIPPVKPIVQKALNG